MTEMVNGTSQGQDTPVSQPVTPMSQPSSSSSSSYESPAVTEEKLLKQSDVTEIVKRAKHEAVETFKRMQIERPDYVQQKHPDFVNQQNQSVQQSHNQPLTNEDYRRMASEEAKRLLDERQQEVINRSEREAAEKIIHSFFNKLSAGKEKYQDFEKVTGDISFANFTTVVQLADGCVDNTSDVIYELGKDRTKLSNLEVLARMSPRDAVVQIQRLSQSIKDNEAASKTRQPNSPLSQLKPSNTGTDSGDGTKSVSDYMSSKSHQV